MIDAFTVLPLTSQNPTPHTQTHLTYSYSSSFTPSVHFLSSLVFLLAIVSIYLVSSAIYPFNVSKSSSKTLVHTFDNTPPAPTSLFYISIPIPIQELSSRTSYRTLPFFHLLKDQHPCLRTQQLYMAFYNLQHHKYGGSEQTFAFPMATHTSHHP